MAHGSSFTTAFLWHALRDLETSSINRDAISEIRVLQSTAVPGLAREDRRMAWALLASLSGFAGLGKEPYQRTYGDVDLNVFCDGAANLLVPHRRALTIDVAEAAMLDLRDERIVEQREKESEMKQLARIEQLILCARRRYYRCAAIAFYGFIYRLCANVELLPAWAKRLTEIE